MFDSESHATTNFSIFRRKKLTVFFLAAFGNQCRLLLGIILVQIRLKPHEDAAATQRGEASVWCVVWVGISLLFGDRVLRGV